MEGNKIYKSEYHQVEVCIYDYHPYSYQWPSDSPSIPFVFFVVVLFFLGKLDTKNASIKNHEFLPLSKLLLSPVSRGENVRRLPSSIYKEGSPVCPSCDGEAGLFLLLWLFRRFLFPFAAREFDHDGLSAIDVGGKKW